MNRKASNDGHHDIGIGVGGFRSQEVPRGEGIRDRRREDTMRKCQRHGLDAKVDESNGDEFSSKGTGKRGLTLLCQG